jgi:hypothetical protein
MTATQDRVVPIAYSGRRIRPEPLGDRHAPGLVEAGRDERIRTLLVAPPIRTIQDARSYVAAMTRDLEM